MNVSSFIGEKDQSLPLQNVKQIKYWRRIMKLDNIVPVGCSFS